jgi:hypothetical protein
MFAQIATRTGVQLPSPPVLMLIPSARSARFSDNGFVPPKLAGIMSHLPVEQLQLVNDLPQWRRTLA